MGDCLFCKIVSGEIPSYAVYEDETFTVILDKFPSGVGHCLIIPKKHAETALDVPDNILSAVFPLAKKVAAGVEAVTACDGVNIIQNNGTAAGQTIPHFHVHVIPRFFGDKMNFSYKPINPSEDELFLTAEKLKGVFDNV
ncbi:HIT family protein [Clostridia bacterium]|nr:HIT family protein [Clostridia bacterium]